MAVAAASWIQGEVVLESFLAAQVAPHCDIGEA